MNMMSLLYLGHRLPCLWLIADSKRSFCARTRTGLLGMCEGEKRRLTIPSDHGYGNAGAGANIHAGATLVFDVELLTIG